MTDTTNSRVIFQTPITAAGQQNIPCQGLMGAKGANLSVSLSAGGTGIIGYVNAVAKAI